MKPSKYRIRRMDTRLVLAFLFYFYNACEATIDDQTPEHLVEGGLEDDMSSKIENRCETLPSKIRVTKEEHDQAGNVIRVCEGSIIVNKCEGTCLSHLRPSITTPTGFLKVLKVLFWSFS
jgi:hypothetical protein